MICKWFVNESANASANASVNASVIEFVNKSVNEYVKIDDVDEDEVEINDAPGVGASGSAFSRSATSPENALEAGEASGTQALDALLDQLSQGT